MNRQEWRLTGRYLLSSYNRQTHQLEHRDPPLVVIFAEDLVVLGEAGLRESDAADGAHQTLLVPRGVHHPQQEAVGDLLIAAGATLQLLTLDLICRPHKERSAHWYGYN